MSDRLQDRGDILIWGLGREGRAVLDLVLAEAPDAAITIVDAKEPAGLPQGVRWIAEDDLEAAVRAGRNPLIVKSPGVSLYDPRLDAALKAGAALTSQTNLFFARKPKTQSVFAVTGTKGKSTSSALLHHMLRGAGVNAALAGNIGDPALLAPREAETVVLEMSSYQIADLVHAPDRFIFLNLSNDHAPWHRGVERYRSDKARLARLDPNTAGVMNAADPRLIEMFGHQPNRVWFGREDGFHARDGAVVYKNERWGPIAALPGGHNALNACAGLALIDSLGLDARAAFESLSSFKGLPHRLQTVHETGGVIFVDDGLATTPEACVHAVSAFAGRPVALLLGGEEREQDYAWLAKELDKADNLAAVICLKDNGPRIAEALSATRHAAITQAVPEIEDAVAAAFDAVKTGGVVLLSPAAPRCSAYQSFAERGAAFTAAAKAL
ncbi:MAG: UDP-N-acetylmuramoyl-L-alanine--D-glutamate ligase [Oceanicaulis sp.]